MKINCGPTRKEKRAALEQWHPWFAWRPVRVGSHDCRWFETIERKSDFYWGYRFNEYRAPVSSDEHILGLDGDD